MAKRKFNIDLEPMSDNPEGMHTLMSQIQQVPIADLKFYPGNARRGDVSAVAESLQYHGQFKPIVVQRSTGYVLAGNHTLRAAKEVLNWRTIGVVYVDVDDTQAKKILLADNRTSDLGDYDYDALYQILADVPDPIGTGYTQDIIDQINQTISDIAAVVEDEGSGRRVGKSAFSEDDDPVDVDEFDDISDVMSGVASLKPDVIFSSQDPWGLPDLLPEMLMGRIEQNIDTWSGPTSSSDDGSSYYMYAYGTDSTKGMPWDRTLLCFYTSDSRFENWWADPAKYTTKMLNAGVAAAVTHDFSMFAGYPRVLHLFNAYRAKWLARYMQEAGIKVIPNITFCDEESLVMSMIGLPRGLPVISKQMQTIDAEKEDPKALAIRQDGLWMMVETLEPEQLIIYGNEPGFEMVRNLQLPTEVLYVDNRSVRRSRWQKERDAMVYKDRKTRKSASRVTGISQTGVAMRGF